MRNHDLVGASTAGNLRAMMPATLLDAPWQRSLHSFTRALHSNGSKVGDDVEIELKAQTRFVLRALDNASLPSNHTQLRIQVTSLYDMIRPPSTLIVWPVI